MARDFGPLGRALHGDGAVPAQRVPRLLRNGDPAQRDADVGILGVLLGEAQVLREGAVRVALLEEHLGQRDTRLTVGTVVAEHVAELDRGARQVARLAQLHPGAEEVLRLLLRVLARGQEDHEAGQGDPTGQAHGNRVTPVKWLGRADRRS